MINNNCSMETPGLLDLPRERRRRLDRRSHHENVSLSRFES